MAAIDFATREDLIRVEKKLDQLLDLLGRTPKVITVSQIAKELGLAETTLRYKFPWLLPNFGDSQYPGIKRWDVELWHRWKTEKTADERKAEYLSHVTTVARRQYTKHK